MIFARRRLGTITWLWALSLLGGVLVAQPFVAAVAATGVGVFPEGDALLFEPGGVILLETLRLGYRGLSAAVQSSFFSALVVMAAHFVGLTALLSSLASSGRLRLSGWARATADALPGVTLMAGLGLLARAAFLAVLAFAYAVLLKPALEDAEPKTADLCKMGALLVLLAGWVSLGVFRDLAAAAVVRQSGGVRVALKLAVSVARRRSLSVALGWLWPAAMAFSFVCAAGVSVGWLPLGRDASWPGWIAFGIHQAAVFLLVMLRAVWLATALRLVGPTSVLPRSAGRSAGTDVLADPSSRPAA